MWILSKGDISTGWRIDIHGLEKSMPFCEVMFLAACRVSIRFSARPAPRRGTRTVPGGLPVLVIIAIQVSLLCKSCKDDIKNNKRLSLGTLIAVQHLNTYILAQRCCRDAVSPWWSSSLDSEYRLFLCVSTVAF